MDLARGARSWTETRSPASGPAGEGPRTGLPPSEPLGTSGEGLPCTGWPGSPASRSRGCSPSPLSLLGSFRQRRPTLGNGLDFRFDSYKNKHGRPSQPSTLTPTPPSRAPPMTETVTVSWAHRMEGGGCHGDRVGLWLRLLERRLARGACWGVRHWPSIWSHSSLWEVGVLRGPLAWCLPGDSVSLSHSPAFPRLSRGAMGWSSGSDPAQLLTGTSTPPSISCRQVPPSPPRRGGTVRS